MVRVRFAPSPTGFQHVGGFRTALYAWLFARRHGGQFLLRVEDTDQERRVQGAVRYLLESLMWLGMDIDEGPSREELRAIGEDWEGAPQLGGLHGPYIQSLRKERYREAAEQLIAAGYAYRCDCTAERLEQERAEQTAQKVSIMGYSGYCRDRNVPADTRHVVRLRIPEDLSISLKDLSRGEIAWDHPPLRDAVLLKSDGLPTYHLASVVDDHAMQITHVLRGEEWISTTPIHLMLYKAFGWEPPQFCHLSLILGPDGKKLSKRHGAESLDVLREKGLLPEAVFNYMVLVGWSPGNDQELFTREELIKAFSLDRLNRAGGVFDQEKLTWMNGVYIRALPPGEFAERAIPYLEKAGLEVDRARWDMIAPHVQERTKLMPDIVPRVDFLFKDAIERETKEMFKKGMDRDTALAIIDAAKERLAAVSDFSVPMIEQTLRGLIEERGDKVGPAFGVVRIAVTGKTVTPPLFESLAALGREETVRRLEEARAEVAKLS